MQTSEKIAVWCVLGFVWFMGFMNPVMLLIAFIVTAIFVYHLMNED